MAREIEFEGQSWSVDTVGASHGGSTGGMRHQVRFTRRDSGHQESSWISVPDVSKATPLELQRALAAARDPLVKLQRELEDSFAGVATIGTPYRQGKEGSVWVKSSFADAAQEFRFRLDGNIETEIDDVRVSINQWIVKTGRATS